MVPAIRTQIPTIAAIIVALVLTSSAWAALPMTSADSMSELPDMLERVVPGVVNISTRSRVRVRGAVRRSHTAEEEGQRSCDSVTVPRDRADAW